MDSFSDDEHVERINHYSAIALTVILRPKHQVIDARIVALEKHVSRAERNENTMLIEREHSLPFHREHCISVATVRFVVKRHKIRDAMIWLTGIGFAEVLEQLPV